MYDTYTVTIINTIMLYWLGIHYKTGGANQDTDLEIENWLDFKQPNLDNIQTQESKEFLSEEKSTSKQMSQEYINSPNTVSLEGIPKVASKTSMISTNITVAKKIKEVELNSPDFQNKQANIEMQRKFSNEVFVDVLGQEDEVLSKDQIIVSTLNYFQNYTFINILWSVCDAGYLL